MASVAALKETRWWCSSSRCRTTRQRTSCTRQRLSSYRSAAHEPPMPTSPRCNSGSGKVFATAEHDCRVFAKSFCRGFRCTPSSATPTYFTCACTDALRQDTRSTTRGGARLMRMMRRSQPRRSAPRPSVAVPLWLQLVRLRSRRLRRRCRLGWCGSEQRRAV